MNKVDKVVHKYLVQVVNKNEISKIQDSSLLREDLFIDSLNLVSLFSNSINELNISITEFGDAELTNINSVNDLKSLFQSKIK